MVALSENPTIYDSFIKQFWQTATVNTLDNGEQEITAIVDGHVKTITIASVRKYLQLADAGGLNSLPNTEIFDQLFTGWGSVQKGSTDNLLLSSPICFLCMASKTKSWLWHRRLSHLNFDYINSLAKQGLVRGLPKLKYQKDHLCSACALGKSKKHSHKPKAEDSIQEKLYMLHMDFYSPMRGSNKINGRKYILVIVDDFSRFTWVKFLRSKDEVLEFVIKFLKMNQVSLNATVRNIRTDNGTEFVNQTPRDY
ncbi:retrovirus-related pol polyprotein from transposon TNT 1-94 [Tanacetum coccineum]